jgi:hypothetical protein
MVACFAPDVGLVAGYARPDPGGSLLQRLLALDNLAVGALGAGALAQGVVLACTGRNLAYRRAVYQQVGGYAPIGHLIGGDDVYFARRLASLTRWRSTYNRDPAAVVACSVPPRGWRDALHQKLRHAGKAGHYRGPALLLGGSVYAFHLLLGWTLLRAAAGTADAMGLAVWLAKAGLDTALLGAMAGAQELRLLPLVPLLELLYIPYVLLFTVAGRLGWFRWKE